MKWLGDFNPSDIFDTKFTTVGVTGAPTTLAGSPVVSCYKNNSTTEGTSGVSLTVDFDSRTGLHNVRVDTSADGTFFSAGSNFTLVVTTGTVGGTSIVGYVVAEFAIQARNHLRPTTAGRTLDVSAGGEAGIDWANIGSPTTAQNLSATNIDVDQVVASVSGAVGSVTGAVGSVTGNVGGNVVGSVASVSGNVGGNVGGNVTGSVGSVVARVTANTDQIEGVDATNQIRDSVFGGVVENSKTLIQIVRGMWAVLGCKVSGLSGSTASFRDDADTKDRIVATVDADGNRSAITKDLT